MTAKETQSKEDNRLILYRLDRVESAVKDVGSKLDERENITKADLVEFRDIIVTRVNEIRDGLQKQLDTKADMQQLNDLKQRLNAYSAAITSVVVGLALWFLTR